MKYRKKPVVIEAITFDELVEHGRQSGAIVNGMPWSFEYNGHPITHEKIMRTARRPSHESRLANSSASLLP